MDVTVDFSGPLFDGRAEAALDDFQDDALREIAHEGYADVRLRLGQVLRHPTGTYEDKVDVDRAAADAWLIHDQKSRYGPWLEGTSERNTSTEFKGYRTFQLVAAALQEKAAQIAQRVLDRYIGRMN